ncbi:hypothetical protein, partial [Vibrio vulnificus]|uniref:hypothetical protein n=1 Tax=Vibrio vulnificus TaxID=672 RepID=UPI0019D4E747
GVGMAVHRAVLLSYLEQALGGDATAAEWLLLHLLSGVRARRGDEAVGAFPLGLGGLPDEAAAAASAAASSPSAPLSASASRFG